MPKKKTTIVVFFIIIVVFIQLFLLYNLFFKEKFPSKNKTNIPNNVQRQNLKAQPKVNFQEQTKFYSVSGSTEQELRNSMDHLGPKNESGRYDSLTSWDIYWEYDYLEKNNLCSIKNISVDLDIEYIYPKINNIEKVNNNLKEKWNNYLNSLKLHEVGHKDIAVEGANNVLNKLLIFPSYNSCDILDEEVESKTQGIISESRAKQEQYDNQAELGISQGAVFP